MKEKIDRAYLLAARKGNPGAGEEVVGESAKRLQEACKANARGFARRRYPNLEYRQI